LGQEEKDMEAEKNSLAVVLDKLMEYQKQNGEKNTLIMLALLNLIGIVSGMNANKSEGQSNSPWGNIPFNPALLMNLLGGGHGKGQGFDLSSLMGLLGNFLGNMPGSGMMPQPHPPKQNIAPEKPPAGKFAGKMKVEKNVNQPVAGEEPKGKPGTGTPTAKQSGAQKNEQDYKPEIIKWNFGEEKKG